MLGWLGTLLIFTVGLPFQAFTSEGDCLQEVWATVSLSAKKSFRELSVFRVQALYFVLFTHMLFNHHETLLIGAALSPLCKGG